MLQFIQLLQGDGGWVGSRVAELCLFIAHVISKIDQFKISD